MYLDPLAWCCFPGMAKTPEWASKYSLELCGQYYQGFVGDFEAVLSEHRMCTVTTYGVRTSRVNACSTGTSGTGKRMKALTNHPCNKVHT